LAFEELKKYRDGQLWRGLLRSQEDEFLFFGRQWHSLLDLSPPDFGRPPLIYHYTDVAGLQGILESNSLWASAAYFLNDFSEIEYDCKIVLEVFAEWQELNKGIQSFETTALRGLEGVFAHPSSRISRSLTTFVACFCQKGNLLSQWRAYGQAGGYSLGFEINPNDTSIALTVPGGFWELRLAKVLYDEHLQRDRIRQIMGRMFEAIRDNVPGDEVSAELKRLLLSQIVGCGVELLLDAVVTFKNPAFEEENEWRLVVRPSVLRTQNEQRSNLTSPIKFRRSRGSLVPYLELRPKEPKLPLRSIRYGPSLQASRVENPLKMFLSSYGFSEVTVTGSEMPVIL
jgi:hypothetical protein